MKNLSFFLFLTISLFASEKRELPVLLNSMTIGSYHSIGFSNMVSTSSSEISSANPASLANFSSLSLGATFEYWTKTDYPFGIELKRPRQWLPASAGVVYPYKNFHFGVAYCQKYSHVFYMGDIPVTSIIQPDGTGDIITIKEIVSVHSSSAVVSYSLKHILNANDCFSVAGQLFWDYLRDEEEIDDQKAVGTGNNVSWKLGALYRLNGWGMGMFYERGVDIQAKKPEYNFVTEIPFTNPNATTRRTKIDPPDNVFNLPDKFAVGISTQSIDNLCVSISLASIFWKKLSDYHQDQLDISAGIVYSLTNRLDFTLGVYKTNRNMSENVDYSGWAQNATFIHGGIRYRIGNLSCRLEISDSHFFTSEYRKKTILILGADYIF